MNRGRSIHIGLNFVDPNAYGGWDGALNACINDATDLKNLAEGAGYGPAVLLTDGQATSHRVLQEISSAAGSLSSGDILFVTYSGHGGQVDDANGDEADFMDETWVLWDRQVVDDELFAMWAQFAPGVRIVVLSDSCHSGTVLRMVAAPTGEQVRAPASRAKTDAANRKVARAVEVERLYVKEIESTTAEPAKPRNMPWGEVLKDIEARGDAYDSTQYVAGAKAQANVQASVLLISGCQDNQLSFDGVDNGRFTGTLLQTWNNGQFQGSYHQFHQTIVAQMPPNQTPNLFVVGSPNQAFENQRPFTIQAPDGTGTGQPSQPSQPASSRPTLRRGDSGQAVRDLQQLLSNHGLSVTIDGIFGWGTEGAVKEFQSRNGLAPDGIVGPNTWSALEGAPGSGGGGSPSQPGGTGGAGDTGGAGGSAQPSGPRPTVQQGVQGQDQHVRYLQQRLQAHGYNVTVDGIFGPRTASMVRSFQASQGLASDGIVGPNTWQALDREPMFS